MSERSSPAGIGHGRGTASGYAAGFTTLKRVAVFGRSSRPWARE
jgi:hypothetical protein